MASGGRGFGWEGVASGQLGVVISLSLRCLICKKGQLRIPALRLAERNRGALLDLL